MYVAAAGISILGTLLTWIYVGNVLKSEFRFLRFF